MRVNTILSLLFCLTSAVAARGQGKYFTRQALVSFDATAGMEKIEGTTHSGVLVLDAATGDVQIAVLLKGFEFEKALMQEHFNENYVESDKYPRCEFRGQVVNNAEVGYGKNGVYPIRIKGMLTLHGQAREILADGKLTVRDGVIQGVAGFQVALADYRIGIPGLVKDKVAERPRITVDCSLQLLKN